VLANDHIGLGSERFDVDGVLCGRDRNGRNSVHLRRRSVVVVVWLSVLNVLGSVRRNLSLDRNIGWWLGNSFGDGLLGSFLGHGSCFALLC